MPARLLPPWLPEWDGAAAIAAATDMAALYEAVNALAAEVRRRDRLGGLVHEYYQAAA
jgi:hypothetical protein